MSDEKKRDRAMQRRVRERQAKTGESYQAAWQQIADPADLEPAPSGAHDAPRVRDDRRILLPFSDGRKVPPGQPAQITAHPQTGSFWPDRLLIKNADRWDIHRLTIGLGKSPWSSLIDDIEDQPRRRPASIFALDTWHQLIEREVPLGEAIALVATYTGPNEEGESFEAALFGWEDHLPTKHAESRQDDASPRVSERAESKRVRASEMAVLPITITAPELFVDRFTIADAESWIVHDIRVCGKSIFVSGGDLPGVLFNGAVPVILEPLAVKDRVEIAATYVGRNSMASLMVELSGAARAPLTAPAVSCFLPLSTDIPIEPTQSAQITGRVGRDFLPERLVVADPDGWIVHDIKVGNRSQLGRSGDIPAQCFSVRAVGCAVTLDRVVRTMDVTLITSREQSAKAAGLFAGIQGRLVQAR